MKKKTRGVSGMKQVFFFFNEVDFKAGFEDIVQNKTKKKERGREFQPVGPKKEEEHRLNC